MEEFAKVEKLVEITGVSFEDARNALRACDGEMVDAMVYLEKLGKVSSVKKDYTDPRFAPISEEEIRAAAAKKEAERILRRAHAEEYCSKTRSAFGDFVRKTMRFLTHNKITISKEGQSNLVLAVGADRVNICKLLVENGSDPDVKDSMGMSAYQYATLFKKEKIAEILKPFHKE